MLGALLRNNAEKELHIANLPILLVLAWAQDVGLKPSLKNAGQDREVSERCWARSAGKWTILRLRIVSGRSLKAPGQI